MEIPTFEFVPFKISDDYTVAPFKISDDYTVAPYIVVIPSNYVFKEIDKRGEFEQTIAEQFRTLFISRYTKSYELFKNNRMELDYGNKQKNNANIDSIVVIFIKQYSNTNKMFVFEIDDTKNHEHMLKEDDIYKMFSDIYNQQTRKINTSYLIINITIKDMVLYVRFSKENDNNVDMTTSKETLDDIYKYIL